MKKSLIALAVAGAFAAPAFAATSNVDVYGKLHMSVSMFDDQPESIVDPATGLVVVHGADELQFSSNASRIGFKGTEDLGGGLSASWQVESGVNLDEQSGTWDSRNSFVGLSGGFGTVLAGNHDTPLKLVGRAVDLFGDTMADSRNVLGGGSDARAKNVVAYISPNFSGFAVAAAYSTDFTGLGNTASTTSGLYVGTTGDREDAGVYNLNATYSNGPLYIGVGYGDGDGHEMAGLGAHYRVAAGYTFGNFKVVGQYDNLEDDAIGTGQEGDFDAWMVGASYTMGAMVFKANYMEGEYDGDIVDSGYENEQWTIGMDYNLSKRTAVYALYAAGKNIALGAGAGSSDQIIGKDVYSATATGDADVSVLSIGMVHSF